MQKVTEKPAPCKRQDTAQHAARCTGKEYEVIRYHSLAVDAATLPAEWQVAAWTPHSPTQARTCIKSKSACLNFKLLQCPLRHQGCRQVQHRQPTAHMPCDSHTVGLECRVPASTGAKLTRGVWCRMWRWLWCMRRAPLLVCSSILRASARALELSWCTTSWH